VSVTVGVASSVANDAIMRTGAASAVGERRQTTSGRRHNRIVPFLITLRDRGLHGHSAITNLFKCDFSYSYAAVDKISTHIACHAVLL